MFTRPIWNDGPQFENWLDNEDAPPIARRHICSGGGKGGGSSQAQQSTSTVSIPPEVLARYNSVNAQAQDVAAQPFQQYTGQFVAPTNDVQNQGIGNIVSAGSNSFQPYFQNALQQT